VLLTVKSNQKTLYRQIGCQFQGKRQIPFTATDQQEKHGRNTTWELKAREAPEHIKANWPGSAWIVEVITDTLTRKGKRTVRRHLFLTSIRTTPEALLRLVRQHSDAGWCCQPIRDAAQTVPRCCARDGSRP
jgi:hypothetical protein